MQTGGCLKRRLEESQVIDLLIDKTICDHGNLRYFEGLTNVSRCYKEVYFDSYYLTKEVLRTELGLESNLKPGDIDILIIPSKNGRMYFEFSSVFEVKIVRPTNKNYQKNSNSLGSSQIFGLIRDGFPLVGLIHVCMNEPINKNQLKHLPNFDNQSEIVPFDPFPFYSIDTQYQRVLKKELPKYIGINIFGLSFDKDENIVTQHSPRFEKFKHGYFNPNLNKDTIEKIKDHFTQNKNRYTEKKN